MTSHSFSSSAGELLLKEQSVFDLLSLVCDWSSKGDLLAAHSFKQKVPGKVTLPLESPRSFFEENNFKELKQSNFMELIRNNLNSFNEAIKACLKDKKDEQARGELYKCLEDEGNAENFRNGLKNIFKSSEEGVELSLNNEAINQSKSTLVHMALREDAEKMQTFLSSLEQGVKGLVPGKEVEVKVPETIKERERTNEKVAEKGGLYSKNYDFARASFIVDNLDAATELLSNLPGFLKKEFLAYRESQGEDFKEHFSDEVFVTRGKNRFAADADVEASHGYRDIQLNVNVGGHILELQIHLREFIQAKSGAGGYAVSRDDLSSDLLETIKRVKGIKSNELKPKHGTTEWAERSREAFRKKIY